MIRCSLCGLIADDTSSMLALEAESSSKAHICQQHLTPEALMIAKKPEIEMITEVQNENFLDDDQEATSSSEAQETVRQYLMCKRLVQTPITFIWDINDALEIADWSNKQLIQCLLDSGVMTRPNCHKCGNMMRPKFRRNCVQNTWLCRIRGKDCSSSSMKTNSIFTAPHINIKDQVQTIISWIKGVSVKEMSTLQTSASERQISDMYKRFRFESFRDWKLLKIGGEMKTVEIKTFNFQELGFQKFGFEDEFFEPYLIVLLERVNNGRAYVDFMNQISAEKVVQILEDHILPDTRILCDDTRATRAKTRRLANSPNSEIQKAVEIFEANNDTENRRLDPQNLRGETCDEFFEHVTKDLKEMWIKISLTERDDLFAERIMKFNGRENQFYHFWQILVKNHASRIKTE